MNAPAPSMSPSRTLSVGFPPWFMVVCVLLWAGSFAWVGVYFSSAWTAQRSHAATAARLGDFLQSSLSPALDLPATRRSLSELRQWNQALDYYLLDSQGNILVAVADRPPVRPAVDLRPIHRFLQPEPFNWILNGTDPGSGGRLPFSASRIVLGDRDGYFYVTIRPPLIQSLKTGAGLSAYLLLVLPGVFFVVALAFAIENRFKIHLRRHVQNLVDAANALARGNYDHRAAVSGNDDLAYLAGRFNAMSDSIVAAEQSATAAESSRRTLVATVLHDLRAPLAAMQGFLELIDLDPHASAGGAKKFLPIIAEGARRQSRFLDGLHELTKFDPSDGMLTRGEVPLREVAERTVGLFQERAREKGVALRLVGEEAPTIYGDRFWVERALTNLVVNAISYTAVGGQVSVEVGNDLRGARLSVTDTGEGIAPEEVPRIFDPFFRGQSGRRRGLESSGIGLSVVKLVTERHGGTVDVSSVVGRGTTFTIRFPAETSEAISSGSSAPRTAVQTQTVRTAVASESLSPSGKNEFLSPLHRMFLRKEPLWYTCAAITLSCTLFTGDHSLLALGLFVGQCLPLWAVRRLMPFRGRAAPETLAALLGAVCFGAAACVFRIDEISVVRALVVLLLAYFAVSIWIVADERFSVRIAISGVLTLFICYLLQRVRRWELLAVGVVVGVLIAAVAFISLRANRAYGYANRFTALFATTVGVALLICCFETGLAWRYLALQLSIRELASIGPGLADVTALRMAGDPLRDSPVEERWARIRTIRPDLEGWVVDGGKSLLFSLAYNFDPPFAPTQVLERKMACSSESVRPLSRILVGEPSTDSCLSYSIGKNSPYELVVSLWGGRANKLRGSADAVVSWIGSLGVLFTSFFWAQLMKRHLSRQVDDRIGLLVETMRRIEGGDSSARAPEGWNDELDQIGATMNKMVSVLYARQLAAHAADTKLRRLVSSLVTVLETPTERLRSLLPSLESSIDNGESRQIASREMQQLISEQNALVDELFLLTKLEMGEVNVSRESIAIDDLLLEIRAGLGALCAFSPAIPHGGVSVDILLLRRVFHLFAAELLRRGADSLRVGAIVVGRKVFVYVAADRAILSTLGAPGREPTPMKDGAIPNLVKFALIREILSLHDTAPYVLTVDRDVACFYSILPLTDSNEETVAPAGHESSRKAT